MENSPKPRFDSRPFRKISEDAEPEIKALHDSEAWAKASWRRKLKLARKQEQRLEAKFKLNFRWLITRCTEERHACENEKQKIQNMLLYPLRFYFSGRSFYSIEYLIDLNISNKQGAFLTKLAKKKNKFMHVEEFHSMKRYGFPIAAIPFRPNYRGYPVGSYQDFWMGAKYALELSDKTFSPKSIEEALAAIDRTKDQPCV